jgi:hypothetical protein
VNSAPASGLQKCVQGIPLVQGDGACAAVDVGGIDRQHRIGCLNIGQQTEAQGTRINEMCRVRAEFRAQPLEDLYSRAIVAQQHIAESEHQTEGDRGQRRPRCLSGALSRYP